MSDVVVNVDKITKIYKLYNQPIERLKESLNPFKKQYHKKFFALNNISFKIKKGEVVGIIGKNGSGKSTILKIITKVLTPSSGELNIKGKITALLELGAGFNPELSGVENIYLNGSIMGFTKEQMDEKLDSIVSFAEIAEFIYQPVKTYSSGMKARLGFSLAINVDPEILIIDEALSVGDIAFARKCYAKIEHMCKDNEITVLFVSHSSSVIKQLCSRAIMLHNGEKILDGNAKDIVNLYDKFMGSIDTSVLEIQKEFNKKEKKKETKKTKIKAINYSDGLVSKSRTEYKENGAKISNIKITNINNEECNFLNFNELYFFEHEITFFESYKNVKVAMFIKNKEGLEISGKGFPLNECDFEMVKKNTTYAIKWKFKNIFNEGFYFVNAGVNYSAYGEKTVLHRVIDAYMFKSVKDEENYSKGMVDIGLELSMKELEDATT